MGAGSVFLIAFTVFVAAVFVVATVVLLMKEAPRKHDPHRR